MIEFRKFKRERLLKEYVLSTLFHSFVVRDIQSCLLFEITLRRSYWLRIFVTTWNLANMFSMSILLIVLLLMNFWVYHGVLILLYSSLSILDKVLAVRSCWRPYSVWFFCLRIISSESSIKMDSVPNAWFVLVSRPRNPFHFVETYQFLMRIKLFPSLYPKVYAFNSLYKLYRLIICIPQTFLILKVMLGVINICRCYCPSFLISLITTLDLSGLR